MQPEAKPRLTSATDNIEMIFLRRANDEWRITNDERSRTGLPPFKSSFTILHTFFMAFAPASTLRGRRTFGRRPDRIGRPPRGSARNQSHPSRPACQRVDK